MAQAPNLKDDKGRILVPDAEVGLYDNDGKVGEGVVIGACAANPMLVSVRVTKSFVNPDGVKFGPPDGHETIELHPSYTLIKRKPKPKKKKAPKKTSVLAARDPVSISKNLQEMYPATQHEVRQAISESSRPQRNSSVERYSPTSKHERPLLAAGQKREVDSEASSSSPKRPRGGKPVPGGKGPRGGEADESPRARYSAHERVQARGAAGEDDDDFTRGVIVEVHARVMYMAQKYSVQFDNGAVLKGVKESDILPCEEPLVGGAAIVTATSAVPSQLPSSTTAAGDSSDSSDSSDSDDDEDKKAAPTTAPPPPVDLDAILPPVTTPAMSTMAAPATLALPAVFAAPAVPATFAAPAPAPPAPAPPAPAAPAAPPVAQLNMGRPNLATATAAFAANANANANEPAPPTPLAPVPLVSNVIGGAPSSDSSSDSSDMTSESDNE